jgi:hypothetical protein
VTGTVRNTSTRTITYSNYAIGYVEAIILERYDKEKESWLIVNYRNDDLYSGLPFSRYSGIAPTAKNVAQVAPGGVAQPSGWKPGSTSFRVSLDQFDLPKSRELRLRLTQVMGTFIERHVQAWRGNLASPEFRYRR